MNEPNIHGNKQPEASGYFSPLPGPDVWEWKGYKKFGWWQYPKQLLSVILTSGAVGFLAGAVAVVIVTVLILNGIQ